MFLDHSTKRKKGIFHKRIYLSFILLHKYSYIHYLILYYQIYLHVYKYTHTHTYIERECIYANYLNSRSLTIWKSFLKLSDICPGYTKIYIYIYTYTFIYMYL